MAKKKYYLTLDTETATLPFVSTLEREYNLTPKQKQNIAIAKPLVYDIGWTISERNGNIVKKENYLIQETFFVPQVFNTAYYKEKRPIYIDLLERGEIKTGTWNEVIEILLQDLRKCDIATAFNAAFDFKKAIPFTERYIKALYSNRYQEWEDRQINQCKKIMYGQQNESKNSTFLDPVFTLRGEDFDIADLWLLACKKLINNQKYKDYCLKNDFLTTSGTFFKTSAETVFSYLIDDEDFIEDHTALSDAIIENEILRKLLSRGKVEPSMGAFPFRELGETYKYTSEPRKIKYAPVVIDKINIYLQNADESNYKARLERIVKQLQELLEENGM